ncbi:MAG: hypothetical protein KDI51_08695 [Xanthomonadales bacterium]|nr:hypothetical protein [Xanthomonadales bacterium]
MKHGAVVDRSTLFQVGHPHLTADRGAIDGHREGHTRAIGAIPWREQFGQHRRQRRGWGRCRR